MEKPSQGCWKKLFWGGSSWKRRTLTQPVRDRVHARCDCIWFARGEGCAGGQPLRWLQPPSKTEGKHPEGVTPDKLPNNPARDAPRPPSSLATGGGLTPETGGGTVLLEVPEGCRPPSMSGTTSGGKAHVSTAKPARELLGSWFPLPNTKPTRGRDGGCRRETHKCQL